MNFDSLDNMRKYFEDGKTQSYEFRMKQLRNLKDTIKKYENEIINALKLDLAKPEFEAYTGEVGFVYQKINDTVKNLKRWMKPRKVSTPIYLHPAKSYIYPQPKGVVLIISPWNYPFQLAISPLVGAISAGNCVVLQPSNQSTNTEAIISKIIAEAFREDYIRVITGPGSKVVEPLVKSTRFDHILFTGSQSVGKRIMKLAAEDLTPITLELGGKSPGIVCKDEDLNLAAKKIVWGKFYNAGQTCVSPDYVLVHRDLKDKFISKLKGYIDYFYGKNRKDNIGRIINSDRFDKLLSMMEDGNIVEGGFYDRDELYISPTIIDNISLDYNIMQEEIFGPLLPIVEYHSIIDAVNIIKKNPYPLALYLFTKNKEMENFIIENIQFGGGCVNEAISHLVNPKLPFGGIGYSGMGRYHSQYSFDEFSHLKSVLKSKGRFELDLQFPPYSEKKLNLAKRFMK